MNQLTLNKKWLLIFIILIGLSILLFNLLDSNDLFDISSSGPVTLHLSGPLFEIIKEPLQEQLANDLNRSLTLVEGLDGHVLFSYQNGIYQIEKKDTTSVSILNDDFDLLLSRLEDGTIDAISMPYIGDYLPDSGLYFNGFDSIESPGLYISQEDYKEFIPIFEHYLNTGLIDKWIDDYNDQYLEMAPFNQDEIKVGIISMPPISYIYNNRLYGLSIALINKYGELNKSQIVYITGEKDKLYTMLDEGEIDLLVSDEKLGACLEFYSEPLVIASHDHSDYLESFNYDDQLNTLDDIHNQTGKYYQIPRSLYLFSQSHLDSKVLYLNHITENKQHYYISGQIDLLDSLENFTIQLPMERLYRLSLYDIPKEREAMETRSLIVQLILAGLFIIAIYIIMKLILSQNEKRRLNYLFKHDQLTYLPNNYGLKKLFNPSSQGAFLLIDIKRFKLINDLYGYEVGDQILIEMAHMLDQISDSLIVGRTSGNQFTCIALNDYESYFNKITEAFESLKEGNYRTRKLSLSLSYVEYPKYTSSFDTLIQYLESVMYFVKKNNITNEWTAFDDDIYKHYLNEQELAIEIQTALEKNDFMLFYQPQTELYHEKTIGAEVLVRWVHKERGPIYPDQFLGVAERNGLMRKLDMYMIKNACKQIKLWQDQGLPKMKISVNMSTYTFDSPGMTVELLDIISKSEIDTSWFALEITEESGLSNIKQAKDIMKDIKNHGIRFALDDFGKGYSSINYLDQLPFDFLKIDKAFVDHIHTSDKSKKLYHLIANLAKLYNMHIIAEGVEYEDQINIIRHDLDTIIQGYYYSKPLTLEDFDARIKNQQS
ncbi:EAL domain-containing protein [Acidaminobacter sp. JC074]|uniref:EAL domain-containing protein n=1 Tax=Acidaminobacter sp. JC074 TaxID=2530199 RepID=UPI001F0F2B16|nr:EAL domain-containing protein [Acidaminobacter sp. JC074]MCH4890053.1 EAL domain-containing protein [Acidaminobacter sp. JC074]